MTMPRCSLLRSGYLVAPSAFLLTTMFALLEADFAVARELTEPVVEKSAQAEAHDVRSEPSLRSAQNTHDLTLSITIDSKKNRDYVKADDTFSSFVYEALQQSDTIKLQLASKEIMGIWKGNAPLKECCFFEDQSQFAPVFIVAQVRNDGSRAVQLTDAYLDVAFSATDLEPYLQLSGTDTSCGGEGYSPRINIVNYGWGPVSNARLVYTFGTNSAHSPELVADVGSFDETVDTTVEGGLRNSGVEIDKIRGGKFKCPSNSQVPACLGRLKQAGLLGSLANYVYTMENQLLINVLGSFQYDWTDVDKNIKHRISPFGIVSRILFFETGGGPECGAPGPVDRTDKPVLLSLDRRAYRISLGWKGQLKSRQISSFALSLAAEKSSHHFLKLILVLADGSTLNSSTLDLSYFMPRLPSGSPDNPEDNK
jgi:hypothetical protein